jgi:16S rRNA (uracil1498-N3)-methyltransferase
MKIKARLYCPDIQLTENICFSLGDKQAHYVRHVMRAIHNDYFGIFDGINGEYACQIIECDKKNLVFKAIKQIRPHLPPTNMALIFAIIKKTPLEFLIQKATELGVGILQPIITDRTVIRDINQERLESIATEASEQCGLTAVPVILPPKSLSQSVSDYQKIIFCDERGTASPIKNLMLEDTTVDAIVIGPEGGFSDTEADFLYTQNNIVAVSLGRRIMRAETAALASLAIIQAIQDFYRV